MTYSLVLLRHGQSTWNLENRFTGWYDADLTDQGRTEAAAAGHAMADAGVPPDVLHTSLQVRAIRTAELALDAMGLLWLPVRRHWRLNERHYGDLQGKDKKQTTDEHGAEKVKIWRRSYDVPPPPMNADDPDNPRFDRRYADLAPDVIPDAECLADVVARMMPYWYDAIVPDLGAGRTVLVDGARQQPAGAGQAPRRHLRRRHRRAQPAHRRAHALRAGRRLPAGRAGPADRAALPRRRRGGQGGGRGRAPARPADRRASDRATHPCDLDPRCRSGGSPTAASACPAARRARRRLAAAAGARPRVPADRPGVGGGPHAAARHLEPRRPVPARDAAQAARGRPLAVRVLGPRRVARAELRPADPPLGHAPTRSPASSVARRSGSASGWPTTTTSGASSWPDSSRTARCAPRTSPTSRCARGPAADGPTSRPSRSCSKSSPSPATCSCPAARAAPAGGTSASGASRPARSTTRPASSPRTRSCAAPRSGRCGPSARPPRCRSTGTSPASATRTWPTGWPSSWPTASWCRPRSTV